MKRKWQLLMEALSRKGPLKVDTLRRIAGQAKTSLESSWEEDWPWMEDEDDDVQWKKQSE